MKVKMKMKVKVRVRVRVRVKLKLKSKVYKVVPGCAMTYLCNMGTIEDCSLSNIFNTGRGEMLGADRILTHPAD